MRATKALRNKLVAGISAAVAAGARIDPLGVGVTLNEKRVFELDQPYQGSTPSVCLLMANLVGKKGSWDNYVENFANAFGLTEARAKALELGFMNTSANDAESKKYPAFYAMGLSIREECKTKGLF